MDRYDTECIPPEFQRDKVAYIRDKLTPKNCSRFFKVKKHLLYVLVRAVVGKYEIIWSLCIMNNVHLIRCGTGDNIQYFLM